MADWTDKLSRRRPDTSGFFYDPFRDAASMSGLMPKAYSDYELFADPRGATGYQTLLTSQEQTPESRQDFLRMHGFQREATLPSEDEAMRAVGKYERMLIPIGAYQNADGALDAALIAGELEDGVGAAIFANLGKTLYNLSRQIPRLRDVADRVNEMVQDDQLAWDRANNPNYDAEQLADRVWQQADEEREMLWTQENDARNLRLAAANHDEQDDMSEEEYYHHNVRRALF